MTSSKGTYLVDGIQQTLGRLGSAVFFALLLLSAASQARAEGLRIYGLSAEAQGRGEAVIASASDASAIWYNPARMSTLSGTDISLNMVNMFLYADNTDASGHKEKSQNHYFTPFGIYYASPITEKLAVGIGANTPFGLSSKYDHNAPFRYVTTGAQVNLINLQPTVSYKFSKAFSAGFGINYYYSDALLEQQYPWFAVAATAGLPDGHVKVKEKGDGFGFSLGFNFDPTENQSIGLTYHSQVSVMYKGTAKLDSIPGPFQTLFAVGPSYSSDAKTTLRYPDIIALGYAIRPNDRWTWEVGGQWSNWTDFKSADVNLDQPLAFLPSSRTALNWKNSYVVRLGGEYKMSDKWAFSGGYFFDKSPTRESTYSPFVPEWDHHVVSAGVRYNASKSLTLRLPVVGIFQDSKKIDSNTSDILGTQIDGKYALTGYQIGLAAELNFGK